MDSKHAFDCTTKDWKERKGPKRINFESLYPEEMYESIVGKWNALGLEEKAKLQKVKELDLFIPGMT